MRRREAALAAAVLTLLAGCGTAAEDDDPSTPGSGMDATEYCASNHATDQVEAQPVEGGVEVTWYRYPEPSEPTAFVVYRRESDADGWQRLDEVERASVDDLVYLDAAAVAGVTYEYTVTVVDEMCGGESAICDEAPCTVPTVVARDP